MFHHACKMGAEGIISKRAAAPYSGIRSPDWLKSKCLHEQEFVIGGYTLPGKGKAGGPGIGALLLGYYDERKKLIYAGRTGTGFTQKFAATLRKQLEVIQIAKQPFASITTDAPARRVVGRSNACRASPLRHLDRRRSGSSGSISGPARRQTRRRGSPRNRQSHPQVRQERGAPCLRQLHR